VRPRSADGVLHRCCTLAAGLGHWPFTTDSLWCGPCFRRRHWPAGPREIRPSVNDPGMVGRMRARGLSGSESPEERLACDQP